MRKIIGVPEPEELSPNYYSSYPSVSDINDYIPVHAIRQGDLYTSEVGNKLLFYNLNFKDHGYSTRKFSAFAENIMFTQDERWFPSLRLAHTTILGKYYTCPGMLVKLIPSTKEVIPLLLLTVKTTALYNIRPDNLKPEYFSLLVDRKLVNGEEEFKVYRNVKKFYVDIAEQEIDVVYSNDITKLCFNPEALELPQFRTFNERLQWMSTINEQVFKMLTV